MTSSGNADGRVAVLTGESRGDGREVAQVPHPEDWEGIEQWIIGVLWRARQAAEALDGPDNVRGTLYMAHCFADELAAANPRFDRLSFIKAVTEGPS
jgi:hypothetical protein